MEDLAVKSISYGAYWFLAGAVPVLFTISVLVYMAGWKGLRNDLRERWHPTWQPFAWAMDGDESDPDLLVWFCCHVAAVAVLVVAALYSPATDLGGMAVFAAELWLVVPIVLVPLVMLDGMPWRLAVAFAVLWLIRFEAVMFLIGSALFYPEQFTRQYRHW